MDSKYNIIITSATLVPEEATSLAGVCVCLMAHSNCIPESCIRPAKEAPGWRLWCGTRSVGGTREWWIIGRDGLGKGLKAPTNGKRDKPWSFENH